MKKARLHLIIVFLLLSAGFISCSKKDTNAIPMRIYNGPYNGEFLNRVAFPIGGIGAGMICLEATGGLSHVSVRNKLEYFNEPCAFSAIYVKGHCAKVLEGPVPARKIFGVAGGALGVPGTSFGLPRFREASFKARFPFVTVLLNDPAIPLEVAITGWSPFIPGNADDASLPVGALEYHFENPTNEPQETVFS